MTLKQKLTWLVFAAGGIAAMSASAATLAVNVIDKDGKPVPDAVVVIIPAQAGSVPRQALPSELTITQSKMQFVPAVTLAPVGAKLKFVNEDPWDHHVRSSPAGMGQFSSINAGFELRLDAKPEGKPGKAVDITLDRAGVIDATLMGCHLHSSMRGFVYVSASPWASKTSSQGLALFEDLPDGPAQIKVWQSDQLIDLPVKQITLGSTMTTTEMQLTVVPRRRRN